MDAIAQRFWSKVNRTAPNGCWEWAGPRNRDGYGHFQAGGRSVRAHRFSREMDAGPIPAGLCVCHRCDNPSCVRPDHLFVGTQAENLRDMHAKGRGRFPRGQDNGRSKLDEVSVRFIRALRGKVPQRRLASMCGVSKTLVVLVQRREVWEHIS